MRRNIWILTIACLLAVAGAWFFWPHARRVAVKHFAVSTVATVRPASTAPQNLFAASTVTNTAAVKTNRFAYRLTNTTKTIGQLTSDRHAILLENALIDTGAKLNLSIPKHLRADGNPGAYIVQARGPIDGAFRASLAQAGAQVVSYIPNDAYLVRLSAAAANGLSANALVQAVLPYEPYYKVQFSLLDLAVNQQPLPSGQVLTLGLFNSGAAATVAEIEKLGGKIVATDRSPFGPIVRVQPPKDWLALVQLPGVQLVEPATRRVVANDLTRVTVGVATDTLTNVNWLGLSGSNVLVEVNDTGIDWTHPDFTTGGNPTTGAGTTPIRVLGDKTNSLVDIDGHGTHVAGIIAGNGDASQGKGGLGGVNVGAFASGSLTNADFRGKATLAKLFSVGFLGPNDANVSDQYLQETPALTNALISNNSWVNGGAKEYDLSAASYDAAVRDALPEATGPQPVLFVFAAGNDGHTGYVGYNGGNADGGGGTPDSIDSPGTAKNVITVGALESERNITNTYLPLGSTNPVAAWKDDTDHGWQVARYSSRGNVGIGTEGTYGRFKPDVVAPGTFIVSTRSSTWDEASYYNPTNYYGKVALDQVVITNSLTYYSLSDFGLTVPPNAVSVSLQIYPISPSVTNLPIYVSLAGYPDPVDSTTYDFVTHNNSVTIPPDGGSGYLASIISNSGGFYFGVGDPTNVPVIYDLLTEIITTNDLGNYYTVLSNLNNTLGPYYRYESGTSMATPAVSGVLALMQDFFTNTLHTTPSPALLKAMLINGARPTGFYNYQVNNNINYEGWGLVNLPNSIPAALTNLTPSLTTSFYFIDQSPTNALATGESRTYTISLSPGAQALPLRLTLAWTDPPGNPAAALKLVNNLDLIVTNLDNPTNPVVYYGNDIGANQVFNTQENPTNTPANLDAINNVENIFLPANAGTNFTVVIRGTGVNVNAVTTQTNTAAGNYAPNIVQDFALVMASGNGSNTNSFTITATSATANPTGDQRITTVTGTNSPLMNELVGAASPVMATNTISFAVGSPYATNALLTIGQTNQWHFYIITNTGPASDFTNAAFITFLPQTLAIPREGVFANAANSTRPQADIDLYVASGPTAWGLTNLDPNVISNCVNGTQVGVSFGGVFNGASVSRSGTEFVVDTNSTPGQVYYVGVKSEDQMASEYAFLPEFSNIPFSQMNSNGESVVFFQVEIPDGDATHPGYTNTIGLAIFPVDIERVVATNVLVQQNVGDLVVALNHPTEAGGNGSVVLLSHDSPNVPGTYTYIYDDSGQHDITNSQPADGPGTLNTFARQEGQGVWILHAADNAPGFIGNISGSLFLEKHQDLTKGLKKVTVQPGTWWFGYVDATVGDTNLLVVATNLPPTSTLPIQLYLNYKTVPTFSNYLREADLIYGTPPGNSISYGPPLDPGTYWVGLFNPDTVAHDILIGATLAFDASAITTVDYASTGNLGLIDDTVTYDSILVTDTDLIQTFKVGLRVDHERISDLVFHLISPDGTRYLLMENRGGDSTNGCGSTTITTNFIPVNSSGGRKATTNFFDLGFNSGSFTISWNFYAIPDTMDVYYQGVKIFSSGLVSFTGSTTLAYSGSSSQIEVVMNATNHPAATLWTYTIFGTLVHYNYLKFTEETNLTTTPIKYAALPLLPDTNVLVSVVTNYTPVWHGSFEGGVGNSTPGAGSYFAEGWRVNSGTVDWITNGTFGSTAYEGGYYIDLNGSSQGVVSTNVPTVVGSNYTLSFAYAGNPAAIGSGVVPSARLLINGSSALAISPATNNSWVDLQWATTSVVFTATSALTPIEFDSLTADTNGVLLDAVDLKSVSVVTNTILQLTNLYYLPEQSLAPLIGTSPFGKWQLEVLDNRAGAGITNVLVSWQLEFQFAYTNLPAVVLPSLFGFNSQTNQVAAGDIQWYQVDAPAIASFATNLLLFASAPVNLLFSANYFPTTGSPGDAVLLASSTGGIGLPVLSTNTTPLLVPGSIYYLGVENLNAFTVTNAVEVDFDHGNPPPGPASVHFSSAKASSSNTQLSWSAAAGAHYQVQWKDSLAGAWNTIPSPATTTSNGVSTFTDDGAQSAPLGAMRFYRLVWVP